VGERKSYGHIAKILRCEGRKREDIKNKLSDKTTYRKNRLNPEFLSQDLCSTTVV
jgi:hypothetical protein